MILPLKRTLSLIEPSQRGIGTQLVLSGDAVVVISCQDNGFTSRMAELWERLVCGSICVFVQTSEGCDHFSMTTFRLRRTMENNRVIASRLVLLGHSIVSPVHHPVDEDRFLNDQDSGLAVVLKFDVLHEPERAQIEIDVATIEAEFPSDKTRVFGILTEVFGVVQAAATASLTLASETTGNTPSEGGKNEKSVFSIPESRLLPPR